MTADLPNHEYPFDKPFRGEVLPLKDHVGIMWHSADVCIRSLLELVEQRGRDDPAFITAIYVAKCWLKDYEELDRRLEVAAE